MIDLSINVHCIMFVKLGILYYIHVAILMFSSHFFLFVCGRCGNHVMRIFILVHFGYYFWNEL